MPEGPTFHWFLPMGNDQVGYGARRTRPATPDYLVDVARAAEANGFESMLLATQHDVRDTWLTAALVAQHTERIRFIVAFRTGYTLPTLSAQMLQSFEELFGSRIDINIVTGSVGAEQLAYGDDITKDERYQRTAEFWSVLNADLRGERYDFDGDYYRIRDGGRPRPLRRKPIMYFGGLSDEAAATGARFADVQLMYGETPPMAAEHVERVAKRAADYGRSVEFGIRIQVISRDRSADAWAETDRILDRFTPEQVAARQHVLAQRQSIGQARVQSLNPGVIDRESLRPYRSFWSGLGLVSGGGGSTALVGSHEEVAEVIQDYLDVGVRHFIVSGSPLLEEAYSFGEGVIPLFRSTSGDAQ